MLSWCNLPDHVLVSIFSNLDQCEYILQASEVCRNWHNTMLHPQLWNHIRMTLDEKEYHGQLHIKCIKRFGKYAEKVTLLINQSDPCNRHYALQIFTLLCHQASSITHLTVGFIGENPLFYGGEEFVEVLHSFFSSANSPVLQMVNLSGLHVKLSNELLYVLSYRHSSTLRNLNIQNKQMICLINPKCLTEVIRRCRKLTELSVFYASLEEDSLIAFTESDRARLKFISMVCTRQDKYRSEAIGLETDVSNVAWRYLYEANPDAYISLKFDSRVPVPRISEIMRQTVPVHDLRLETFTLLHKEIKLAASLYADTLESVNIQTPMNRNMENAILELAACCHQLKQLAVLYPVSDETVDQLKAMLPNCALYIIY